MRYFMSGSVTVIRDDEDDDVYSGVVSLDVGDGAVAITHKDDDGAFHLDVIPLTAVVGVTGVLDRLSAQAERPSGWGVSCD